LIGSAVVQGEAALVAAAVAAVAALESFLRQSGLVSLFLLVLTHW